MGHIWCCVEQTMNAVAAVALHHTISVRLNVLLNDIAKFAVTFARLHDFDSLLQRFIGDFHQILMLLGHIANEKCFVQIAVEATMVHGDIDVTQITVLRD